MLREPVARAPAGAKPRRGEAHGVAPSRGFRHAARAALLALPLLLLLGQLVEPSGRLEQAARAAAVPALLVAPGYALLCLLRHDPLADGGASRWILAVPLGLAADVLLGTILVTTPARLTATSMWAGISLLSLVSLLRVRRP